MQTESIERTFQAMGARLKCRVFPLRNAWTKEAFSLDIQADRLGEYFQLNVPASRQDQLEVLVAQSRPRQRHLLLLIRDPARGPDIDRFLCGHDESHWFVAAVPERVSSVDAAMESLKPPEVVVAQDQARLRRKHRHRRRNPAFRRQGEWFFLPAPGLVVDPRLVLHREPIRRGGGKPHLVEELYRTGGESVWVSPSHPQGITESEHRRLVQANAQQARQPWRRMVRNAEVYACGVIRHPDHHPLQLPGWHRVVMNTESGSRTMAHVAFLD